ncbi:P-loop containing nucleoside triphosphate hydrolase protein [Suillus bovinus]|uniref:P-loop containing nucleoside triphosphate hydrolase protein n=1 Tax=Suillus bovinus TaxID=48563 RepID=UPI001B8722FE|nr:P-loop containing nucleoside triphosphate hydrolase protein [Suillus bovinus]KAG2127588.1 P-loop containing nucleoside triphosphate hydrolase protein [Suillus bovinus]
MSDSYNSTDTTGAVDTRSPYSQQALQGRPRNVVLYGESGVGKSSLINLIMGRDAAKTSPDALACTTTHVPYDVTISGQRFRLWDTAGLNEGSEGTVPAVIAERNLTTFLRGLNQEDGVHLLIYCVRGTRATKALQTHYKIYRQLSVIAKYPLLWW